MFCKSLRALVVEAHSVNEGPKIRIPEKSRFGIPGLPSRRYGSDLDVAKAQGRGNPWKTTVLIQTRGLAYVTGKTQPE